MKYELNQDSGLFAVGALAAAKHFREGIPMARSVDAEFPVLTATLDYPDYVALSAAADSNVSLTIQVVPHPSAALLQITLIAGGLHVCWLSEAENAELWSAIGAWSDAGECAFAMWLPDGTPYNCLFGKVGFSLPEQGENMLAGESCSTPPDVSDFMNAIVETGNRLQGESAGTVGESNQRISVNLLVPSRIKEQMNHLSSAYSSDIGPKRSTPTIH